MGFHNERLVRPAAVPLDVSDLVRLRLRVGHPGYPVKRTKIHNIIIYKLNLFNSVLFRFKFIVENH